MWCVIVVCVSMGTTHSVSSVCKDRVLYELPVLYERDDVEHAIDARLSKGVLCTSVQLREAFYEEWVSREQKLAKKIEDVRRRRLAAQQENALLQEGLEELEHLKHRKEKLEKMLGTDIQTAFRSKNP